MLASSVGFGGFLKGHWFQGRWPPHLRLDRVRDRYWYFAKPGLQQGQQLLAPGIVHSGLCNKFLFRFVMFCFAEDHKPCYRTFIGHRQSQRNCLHLFVSSSIPGLSPSTPQYRNEPEPRCENHMVHLKGHWFQGRWPPHLRLDRVRDRYWYFAKPGLQQGQQLLAPGIVHSGLCNKFLFRFVMFCFAEDHKPCYRTFIGHRQSQRNCLHLFVSSSIPGLSPSTPQYRNEPEPRCENHMVHLKGHWFQGRWPPHLRLDRVRDRYWYFAKPGLQQGQQLLAPGIVHSGLCNKFLFRFVMFCFAEDHKPCYRTFIGHRQSQRNCLHLFVLLSIPGLSPSTPQYRNEPEPRCENHMVHLDQ